MSQSLTLELSEAVFKAIQQQARAIGISPAQLAASLLERQFPQAFKPVLDSAEPNIARSRFERHFGTLKLELTRLFPIQISLRSFIPIAKIRTSGSGSSSRSLNAFNHEYYSNK